LDVAVPEVGLERSRVHGLRSTFRDWAADQTTFPNEVCEQALARKVRNQVEAAYRRGDMFERRRALMESWGAFCDAAPAANIIPIAAMFHHDVVKKRKLNIGRVVDSENRQWPSARLKCNTHR
jgi:hypothetical protein